MLIDKHDANFERLQFACKALSKDTLTKPGLCNISIESNRIIGCDGHRVHITKGEVLGLEPGQYSVHKCIKSQIIMELVPESEAARYPDVDSVIPDLGDYTETDLKPVLGDSKDTQNISVNYSIACRQGDEIRAYNMKYFADLFGIATLDTLHSNGPTSAMVLKGTLGYSDKCEVTALLMPIRCDA